MFKVGDIVVCVEVPSFSRPIVKELTVGNIYQIMEIRQNHTGFKGTVLFVKDDVGHSFGYSSERFVSIPEYRKRKLKKICSKLVK